ncbi:MAG: ASPIC/UnbV domain-containing protein, partial [Planctomycetota bacterium]
GGLGCSSHRDDTECRFGLGAADKVDWIEVRWPNGKRTIQRFEDLPADAFFTLREGSDPKRVTP